jgi:hypothetical protein
MHRRFLMVKRVGLLVGLTAAVLLTVGCASKVTKENWDLIKRDASTQLEVEQVFGKDHAARPDNAWEFEDEDNHVSATFYFDGNEKVVKKEWVNGQTGEWITDPPEPSHGRKISDETRSTAIKKD